MLSAAQADHRPVTLAAEDVQVLTCEPQEAGA